MSGRADSEPIDAARSSHRLRALTRASEAIAEAGLEASFILNAAVNAVSEQLCDSCAVFLTREDGVLDLVALRHPHDPCSTRHIAAYAATPLRVGEGLIGSVAKDGVAVLVSKSELHRLDLSRGDHAKLLADSGVHSLVIVPLRTCGRVLGTMVLGRALTERAYTSEDQILLGGVANRLAAALDNARLYAVAEEARRQAQQALIDARSQQQRLEEASRHKDEFLAMLAHELRNPLAPLRLAIQILRQGGIEPGAAQRYYEVIDRQSEQMVRLVDDLTDVSRIARGLVELHRESVNMAVVVSRALEATRAHLEQQRHDVSVSLPPHAVIVTGDPARLQQVVVNLLNNAAKYTNPGGRIWIELENTGEQVELRIRDNGIGMAPDMLERSFEPFVQEDRSAARAQGGLGIGLTIVRRLVQLHGGSVVAKSEGPGKGTELVVTLPRAADETARVSQSHGGGDGGGGPELGRVMVVDDNADAAELVACTLREWGHDVCIAADGDAALTALASFRPELILLDIGLPGMDGYELARHLRLLLPQARLIAVTGYGESRDRKRALAAGCDDHVVKPMRIDALARLLRGRGRSLRPRSLSGESSWR